MPYHDLARSALWLGKTVLGEWTAELQLLCTFAEQYAGAKIVRLAGVREVALAALFCGAIYRNGVKTVLYQAPVSYRFAQKTPPDFFSMAIHVPGFLKWGDVSLVAALGGAEARFVEPVLMDGSPVTGNAVQALKKEFDAVGQKCGAGSGKTRFVIG